MRRLPLLILLAGCASPTIPEGTVRIDPPAEYRTWWEASRACVNHREVRRFESVAWYVTPEQPISSDGQKGAALEEDGRIYLWAPYADRPWVIQHELVHAINGIHDHPADPFVRCGLMYWQQGVS